jgi:hypothetical protein
MSHMIILYINLMVLLEGIHVMVVTNVEGYFIISHSHVINASLIYVLSVRLKLDVMI